MKQTKLSIPYIVWLLLFVVAPMILIVFYAFTAKDGSSFVISFEAIKKTFEPIYLTVLIRSIYLSLISTVICFIIGYPMAYIMAKKIKRSSVALMLIMIPMWMNFLLRTYSWLAILDVNGVLNTFLQTIGLPKQSILYTSTAIVIGMVYNFLPFMILPIYSVLIKIPKNYIEAARDLGANRITVFSKIVFPLSFSGVMTGITMVFMPGVTTFAISRLLGGSKVMMMGDLIENQFMLVRDWHFGSALSFVMLIIMLLSISLIKKDMDKGGVLW